MTVIDVKNFGLSTFRYYKTVLGEDSTHVEAIACIGRYNSFKLSMFCRVHIQFEGMNHFYSDQPELSLRFYRRLLQMGIGGNYHNQTNH